MIPSENLEQANEMLETWDDICKELNIPNMLIYGTALGFYRDKGFIKGDNDIDVRVLCNREKWDELVERLDKKDIKKTNPPKGFAFKKDCLLMCIERSEKVGIIIFDNGWEYMVLPLYHKFDIIEYRGRKYNVPHPIEKYLEIRYGDDWKIPNLGWDKSKAFIPRIK